MHGGDRIAEVLEAQSVDCLFTLCGGHISPILSASKQRGIRVIDVRHEATAVFAADATARLSGRPGVAAVTAGPGVTNTITAVKNAQLGQSPVVIIGGAAPTVLKGRGALQDIDQLALFRPHVKLARSVRRVRELVPALEQAFAVAQQGVPGPVFVECPIDLLYDESLVRGWYVRDGAAGKSLQQRALQWYLRRHLDRMFDDVDRHGVGPATSATFAQPAESVVTRVAGVMSRSRRPVVVIGSQAVIEAGQAPALAAAVEQLGAPVFLSGMARGLMGHDHPLHCRHKRRAALAAADCVVLAGVPCDFRLDYGRQIKRGTTLIAINRSRHDLNWNRRPKIGVLADAGEFLRRLADRQGDPVVDREAWFTTLRGNEAQREQEIDEQAAAVSGKINPLQLCRELDRQLPDDSIVVVDGGDFAATASYTVRPRAPMSWLDPGAFGTLGVGAGFAIGAKLVRPDSEVWVIYGDGAFGYSLIEFDTLVRLGIPVIALIGNDAGWTQIAREQTKILGDDVATVLRRSEYDRAAEGLGAEGLFLDSPERLAETIAEARRLAASGRPVVINAQLGATAFREGSISM